MAKAAAPKRSFAPSTPNKGPSAPASVNRARPPAAQQAEEQDDGQNGEPEPADDAPPVASKRPAGAAPSHQEGETLDDLKSRMAKATDGREQVFIAIGKTLNIGNYESVRLDVGLCRPLQDEQDVETLKSDVASEVFELFQKLMEEIKSAVQQGSM